MFQFIYYVQDVRLNKKKFCLKAPARIHFSLRVRLSWNGRFFSSSSSCSSSSSSSSSSFFFFLTFLTKISNLFTNYEKSKCKLSRAALSVSNLVSSRLPSQFSAPFLAIQTNCTGRQWSQQVVQKTKTKRGEKKRIPHPFLKPWKLRDRTLLLFLFF